MPKNSPLLFLFIIFVFSAAAQKNSAKTIPLGKNPNGKAYNIRGLKMYTETYGKGQPLLIIHGNGGSMKDFSNQVPYFMSNYKVILADSRDQGRSPDPGDSLSYEQMADDYAALLTAMNIDSAFVIGWSDGGINGLLLAIRHPEKVKKLAITGANLWPDSTAVYPDVIELVKNDYDALQHKTSLTATEHRGKKLLNLLVNEPHITTGQLQTISCPTLVIGGDHDVIREEHTMLIYHSIPRAYLWILPNSGHSTPVHYKNQFNATVKDFFKTGYKQITGKERFY
ncbi:alpha/beta fold hydrolase [Flavihumibacter profundi]|uniref:alpha/beta fold hydrolase n=1 Tax=Flavihumibacter profundi TaxID=2716883 RepID=UPI001CC80785|nr:alpha/beta hydrolase [Flavihumibacter profundi]MBZ5858079.1 alpha/beta hydrolase [Flavihumibacter profundi]